MKAQTKSCNFYFDNKSPQVKFGVEEIKAELAKKGINAVSSSVAAFKENTNSLSVVFAFLKSELSEICKTIGVEIPEHNKPQSYSIRKLTAGNKVTVAVLAINANGAMYGTLDIAEAKRIGNLNEITNSDKSPFVEKRGFKFNIALDICSPTYSD